ncbi:MAG: DNA primase [Alphaproteobacteria bacterium]|nr:DNA primase [Alphaproteobacteria bacterium]
MENTDFYRFLDEVRSKISIVDVVGAKVKLVRKNREYTGLCPFHNEKTPSFTVNEAKGFYHCFGCGAHGDIIKFEMEANGLPFMDAVTKLANKAGLKVPKFNKENEEEAKHRSSWFEIMELAVGFFEKNLFLPDGAEALNYLTSRGFDEDIIKKFRLGYAPDNNGLRAYLASKNVSESDMIELGLAVLSEKNSKVYDFFRNRVMIPIIDKRNRTIGFGGRVMGKEEPKYLNSPETPIFNKRKILYNLNYARDKAYEHKRIIVCEGYMDVIAQSKFGFDYAVAPLGTALTEDQIQEAWKICPEPTLCFDGDSAGIRAAVRSVDRVLPILKPGYSLKYVFLPDKMDPDEFLKSKGAEEYEKAITSTMPLADLLWKKNLQAQPIDTPEQKAKFEKNIYEEIAKITDEKVRGYYLQDIKNRIYAELRGGASPKPYENKKTAPNSRQPKKKENLVVKYGLDEKVARFILSAFVCHPELISEFEEKVSMFEIPDMELNVFWNKITDICQENENLNAESFWQKLVDENMDKFASSLWEVKMIKQQKPFISKLREEISNKIIEIQLGQIEKDIKECLRIMENSESFPEDVFERYEMLKKDRISLLSEKNV